MQRAIAAFAVAIMLGSAGVSAAAVTRDRAVPRHFQVLHPCPATGKTRGACPGWIRDHIVPLCAGGADSVDNMQWQSIAEAKLKDRGERAECRVSR